VDGGAGALFQDFYDEVGFRAPGDVAIGRAR
jgi:hypothetical protein